MGAISQPGTDQRKGSSKANILQSHDFGPFSKRRRNPDQKENRSNRASHQGGQKNDGVAMVSDFESNAPTQNEILHTKEDVF